VGVPVKIRPATSADATKIHQLHTRSVKELCKEYYTPAQIAGWLKHRRPDGYLSGIERGQMFVAVAGRRIVGFGQAVPGEIIAVFVAPDQAGQGVGRALLARGMQIARRNSQTVVRLEATPNAQGFYAQAGFVEIERTSLQRNDVFLPAIAMEWRPEV
jgi:GNAT superfamily N-acetyltransferase